MQRRGRAVRTRPGECFKMYTKKEEENMDRDPLLDIKKMDISGDIFDVFKEKDIKNTRDVKDLFDQYIEPPPKDSVDYSFNLFKELKLIDSEKDEGKITELGERVSKITKLVSYNIRMATCIVISVDYDCHFDICSLMAILNNIKGIETLFINFDPKVHNKKKYESKKKNFVSDFGDIFSLRKMYETFYRKAKKFSLEKLKDLCRENFLDYDTLIKIRKDHLDFFRRSYILEEFKNTNIKTYDLFTNILVSLLSGYATNIAKKEGKSFKNWFPVVKTAAGIDKFSLLKKTGVNYIIYIELKNIQGNRSYNICSKLTQNQISIINKVYGYNVRFSRSRRRTVSTRKRKINKALLLLKKRRMAKTPKRTRRSRRTKK